VCKEATIGLFGSALEDKLQAFTSAMSRLHLRDILEDKLAVASLRLGGDIYLQDRVGFESNLPLTFIE
jgi:hypothetical protein